MSMYVCMQIQIPMHGHRDSDWWQIDSHEPAYCLQGLFHLHRYLGRWSVISKPLLHRMYQILLVRYVLFGYDMETDLFSIQDIQVWNFCPAVGGIMRLFEKS